MYIFMQLCHKMVFDYLLLPLYAILVPVVLVAEKAWEDIIFSEFIWIENSMKKWRE